MTKNEPPFEPVDRVYIDTNVLFRFPKVLARRVPGLDLVIPSHVVEEVEQFAATHGPAKLIRPILLRALAKGYVRQEALPNPGKFSFGRLSAGDSDLIRHLYGQRRIALATDDLKFASAASQVGIVAITGIELTAWITARASSPPDLDSITLIQRFQFAAVLWAIPLAVLLLALAFALAKSAPSITTAIRWAPTWLLSNLWWSSVIVGAGLFAWRARSRWTYGAVELVFGMASVNVGAVALRDGGFSLAATGIIVAGLYVSVRGWDSIDQGLKDTPYAWATRVLAGPRGS